jgi:hypothetical protein
VQAIEDLQDLHGKVFPGQGVLRPGNDAELWWSSIGRLKAHNFIISDIPAMYTHLKRHQASRAGVFIGKTKKYYPISKSRWEKRGSVQRVDKCFKSM